MVDRVTDSIALLFYRDTIIYPYNDLHLINELINPLNGLINRHDNLIIHDPFPPISVEVSLPSNKNNSIKKKQYHEKPKKNPKKQFYKNPKPQKQKCYQH